MKFYGVWSCKKDVASDFSIDVKALDGLMILMAYYGQGDYEGQAFVLFKRDDQLWEVNGSHCSCMGLEGQWEPEETTVAALQHRLEQGSCFYYSDGPDVAKRLGQILKRLAR